MAKNCDAQKRLITLALMAWNASLLPEEKAKPLTEQMLKGQPGAAQKQMRDFIEEIVERKKKYFDEYKRT